MLKRLSLLILMSCIALTMVLPAMAQYTTGVKSGDWIKYDISMSTTYPYSMSWSFKGTIKMTIQGVTSTTISGTIEVTGTSSGTFPGTPPISTGSIPFSIDRQYWTSSGMFLPLLIPSNLAIGQSIPGADATLQAIVDWQGRKAGKASYMGVEAYWDQATGALLEIEGSASIGYGFATLSIKATDTNMFSLGLGWLLWVIVIMVVVVVVAIVALIVLRRRKVPTVPPPPVQPTPPPPPPPTQQS